MSSVTDIVALIICASRFVFLVFAALLYFFLSFFFVFFKAFALGVTY